MRVNLIVSDPQEIGFGVFSDFRCFVTGNLYGVLHVPFTPESCRCNKIHEKDRERAKPPFGSYTYPP